jgi:predicted ATPase/DNA-binding CsgD family transcriptional regulator
VAHIRSYPGTRGTLGRVDRGVSAREAEVLTLLGQHLTHAEIAATLVLSVRTVESHVASLRRKLGIAGHRDLVRYAASHHPALPDVALTSFVGRSRERAEVATALRASRLVSMVGPGGSGKTRLARVVADDLETLFPDGMWVVDLVPVSDAAGLAGAVASACGVGDLPGRSVEDATVRGLSAATALLVLDNCEHIVNAVAMLVDRLVSECRRVRVLVTSRARLVLPFERVYPLGGLALDGDASDLLIDRAMTAGWPAPTPPERARIDAVCEKLDGLPLALELAAVRLPSLGLDGVERGLTDQSGLLVGGARAATRHRSMTEALEWSYRLLDAREQAVLRRVAVFASGFDADAASAVVGFGPVVADEVPHMLSRLVDQSMLREPVMIQRRWATGSRR